MTDGWSDRSALLTRSQTPRKGIDWAAASVAAHAAQKEAAAIATTLPNPALLPVACIILLRRHRDRLGMRPSRILVDAALDLGPEVAEQPLHRPGGAVAEGADRVALDLVSDVEQRVDLTLMGSAFRHAREHAPHPAHALAAGSALAAALVLVEVGDARHRVHDVGRLVHHDHSRGAER